MGLALATDFRFAAPEARFSANFSRLGFHHGFGLSVTLPRLVGPQVAAAAGRPGRADTSLHRTRSRRAEWLRDTEDFSEGKTAMAERREPRFQGR